VSADGVLGGWLVGLLRGKRIRPASGNLESLVEEPTAATRRAIRVSHLTDKHGTERTAAVTVTRLMSWPSLAQAA
jgi:hypothetical protein